MSGTRPGPGPSGSAARVRAALAHIGLADAIVHFDRSTKTAAMAAEVMGCDLGQIAKSLVFVVDGRPVLALVAGDRRGDTAAIAREAGGISASFADADTVRSATGYAIGGVSPFDLPEDVLVLVDESLGRFEIVYPAAGTPSSMVPMSFQQLLDVSGGRVAPIGEERPR
ncbi:MAG: YbaK/EbsC family protein [Aeromicrobium sp.]|nr:YbaK/EbsC family protein [Aeromicrobium sp.]